MALRTYAPMTANSTRRMTAGLRSLAVWKVAAAALGIPAPDKHDATLDDATAVGARDLHAHILS